MLAGGVGSSHQGVPPELPLFSPPPREKAARVLADACLGGTPILSQVRIQQAGTPLNNTLSGAGYIPKCTPKSADSCNQEQQSVLIKLSSRGTKRISQYVRLSQPKSLTTRLVVVCARCLQTFPQLSMQCLMLDVRAHVHYKAI